MIVDTELKNKTTAKKGMVVGKGTHKKGAMELKWLKDWNYDDKITLEEVITRYEKALNNQEKEFNDKIDKLSSEFESDLKTAKNELTAQFKDMMAGLIKEMQEL